MNKAKLLSTILLAGTSLFVSGQTNIPESPAWDVYPDTWVATDGAGRVMPGNADVGDYKYGKQHTVGIFYVTWHTSNLNNMHSPTAQTFPRFWKTTPTHAKIKTMPRGSRNITTPTIGANPKWDISSLPTRLSFAATCPCLPMREWMFLFSMLLTP